MDGRPSWEDVLADVEAEAARAAALLAAGTRATPPSAVAGASPVLPALADMPPVPARLRERIEELRERIDALQDELATALREWQFPAQPALVTTAAATPHYLDRRA